jgi:cytochrome c oxidase subunit 2
MLPRAQLIRILVLIAVVTVVGSVVLLQWNWFGPADSKQAGPIDTLFDVMIVLSTFVFAVVIVMLGHSVYRYRAKPGDESDGEPIHGNTTLEIIWTAVPTVIVTAGAIYSTLVLADIEKRDPNRMVVKVTSQQFQWSFEYPDSKVKSTKLVVPLNKQIEFQMTSKDVIHSFWVPEWRLKKDNVPGITTRVIVTPTKVGSFKLVCTELCGIGHATMRAPVEVLPAAKYRAWIASEQKSQGIKAPAGTARKTAGGGAATNAAGGQGKQVFAAQGCGSCHTLKAAGSTGTIGPDLDKFLAGKDEGFIRESIVKPNAQLAAGFKGGIMPQNFGTTISKKDLDALVQFLLASTKGK